MVQLCEEELERCFRGQPVTGSDCGDESLKEIHA